MSAMQSSLVTHKHTCCRQTHTHRHVQVVAEERLLEGELETLDELGLLPAGGLAAFLELDLERGYLHGARVAVLIGHAVGLLLRSVWVGGVGGEF